MVGAVVDDYSGDLWWEYNPMAQEPKLTFRKEGQSGSCSKEPGSFLPLVGEKKSYGETIWDSRFSRANI